jgi:peptidyl-prolyl cis-trans isomerase D
VFIYHFHRIIRHRLVWGVFALVVSLLFLFVGYSSKSGANDATVARVGGKRVGQEAYSAFERNIRGVGRNRDVATPESVIATQVWSQAAAFNTAADLGIGVTPDEIRALLIESGNFSTESGAFDLNRYNAALREAGITPAFYENFLEHQLMLRKLGAVAATAAWIAPLELDDELAGWTDQMTVRCALVSNTFAHAALPLTEAELRACYEAHPEEFRLPNRVAVLYAGQAVSNYLAAATVSDDEIHAYYEDHSELFTRTTPSNTTASVTIAEARPRIVEALRWENARQIAATNLANTFMDLAMKNGDDGFVKAAQAFGLTIARTPLFAADEPLPEIQNAAAFREAAFELDASQPESRYTVVRGSNVVYALAALTNSPAHLPAFVEARSRVYAFALAEARDKAFQERQAAIHTNLMRAASAAAFTSAARAAGLNVSTSLTFVAHTIARSSDIPYGMAMLQGALRLRPGEVSDPHTTAEGALFVFMETRQRGDPLSAEVIRPQVRASLERGRAGALLPDWMNWNLRRQGVEVSPKKAAEIAASTPQNDE